MAEPSPGGRVTPALQGLGRRLRAGRGRMRELGVRCGCGVDRSPWGGGRGAKLLFAPGLAQGDEHEAGEGEHDEDGGVDAVELIDLSAEQRQANEDKDNVGAEDFERGLAQGEEGLDLD